MNLLFCFFSLEDKDFIAKDKAGATIPLWLQCSKSTYIPGFLLLPINT